MSFGPIEAVVIVVIVLVIFGAGRLTGVGKALGQGLREFRQEASVKPGGGDGEEEGSGDAAGEGAAAEGAPAEGSAEETPAETPPASSEEKT